MKRTERDNSRTDLAQVLARVPLFSGFAPEEIRALSELAVARRYAAKQLILRQGDPGGALFAIVSGHLKAFTPGFDGHDTLLTIMGPGEVFGEVSLFDGEPRSASVATLDKAELVVISRESLQPFLLRSPALAIKLLEVLAQLAQRRHHLARRIVPSREGADQAGRDLRRAGRTERHTHPAQAIAARAGRSDRRDAREREQAPAALVRARRSPQRVRTVADL
jgi:CRP-like cAMP-binding protein